MSIAKALFWFFAPPAPDATGEERRAWEFRVSASLGCIVVFLISFAMGSMGMFSFITKGFASVDAMDAQQLQLDEMHEELLDTKLFDTRGRQCAAIITRNQSALRSETQRLQEYLVKYTTQTRRDWRIPNCGEY